MKYGRNDPVGEENRVKKQVGQQPEQLGMVTVFLGLWEGVIRKLGAFLENVQRF